MTRSSRDLVGLIHVDPVTLSDASGTLPEDRLPFRFIKEAVVHDGGMRTFIDYLRGLCGMLHDVPSRSGALVLTELGIDDGSFAWKLCMDIVCLSFDGNLADASLIAAMAALLCVKLPGTQRIDDEIFVTEGEDTVCLCVYR